MKITLDCCQACFISNEKMVVSLKGGELYVLTLVVDGMRAVRSFNFDKAAASVLTTAVSYDIPVYVIPLWGISKRGVYRCSI